MRNDAEASRGRPGEDVGRGEEEEREGGEAGTVEFRRVQREGREMGDLEG